MVNALLIERQQNEALLLKWKEYNKLKSEAVYISQKAYSELNVILMQVIDELEKCSNDNA